MIEIALNIWTSVQGSVGAAPARPTAPAFSLAVGDEDGEVIITISAEPASWGDLIVAGDGLGEEGVLEWWNVEDGWQTLVDPSALGPVLVVTSPALWGSISTIRVRGVSLAGRTGTPDEKSVLVQGEEPIPEGSFFVSPSGNNSTGDGSVGNPWRTLTYAATQINASDTITLEDGVYTDANQIILPSGVAGAHTTVRARNRWGAIFQHGNYATFRTGARSYITIDGLYFLLSTGGGGVNSEGGHHITVKNCKHRGGTYHFFAGHNGDFYEVTDNDVSGIRFDSWWSAISFYQLQNVTGVTTGGFRNVIARNKIFDCYTTGFPLTDGNGIIIDDSHNEQDGGNDIDYAYESLIDGNLVVNCGGKGIQVVYSNNVTVRGNTCALNGNPAQEQEDGATWCAEISLSLANNCTVVNNIAIADPTNREGNQRPWADTGLNDWTNTGNVWKNNCGWDGTGTGAHVNEDGTGPLIGDNPLDGTDPEVVSATANALTSNYQLRSGSPCIDAGTAAYGLPAIDIAGASRVADSAVDIGAYEGVAAYALVEQWITSAGLATGQATWTGTVAGTVLTEAGAITTEASDGTNNWLVFPGTAGNYMSKTDGIGPLPSGDDPRTVVICGEFGTGRWSGFSWGEPVNFGAFTLGVQGGGVNTISADYYNAYADGGDAGDVVSTKGPGIWFLTLNSLGVVRLYHGDQLVMEDFDRLLDTGTDRILLMRPYSVGGTPMAGKIGYLGVYDGVLDSTARQAVVDTLNPLYLDMTVAPTASDVVFTANSPTTGTVTATLTDWRSKMTGVITTSATKPSVEQIEAGLDHLGNPAVAFSAIATSAAAEIEIGPIGLTPDATNYPHYYMRDAYGNVGTVQTGLDDDTPAVVAATSLLPVAITFSEVAIAPTVVATLVADVPGVTFSKVSGNAAFTVGSTGIVTLVSNLTDGAYSFVARAANSAGNFDATVNVTVTDAAAAADQAVRFGALTPTGEGGAQARDGAGNAIDYTSIDTQPSTRWTLSSGKLVATGSPAMASEQITATVDGSTVAVNITVVSNMVSIANSTEFGNISMTPAGTGDFTIHLRAGVSIAGTAATSKIAGTSVSPRTLGGTLTLTGETVRGAPSANIDGKFRPLWFVGGAFHFTNCKLCPSDAADQAYTAGAGSRLIECARSPTTDYVLDGLFSVGNPHLAYDWPGLTAATSGNDLGHDPWGALVRVNTVTGQFRPYVDGQVGDPDIVAFGTSGVKHVLLGMHSLGGGVFEMQVSDKTGNDHSVPNNLVSGEGTLRNIISGETITGLDGATAVVMAAPSGVDTAGGYYAGGSGVAYSYLIKGPRFLDTDTVQEGSGVANTCKNLTIRNCTAIGFENALHPFAIEKVIIEQNSFGMFTQDFIKMTGPKATPNPTVIIRRNDFWGSMQRGSDLGAAHCDYIQIFGGSSDDYWKMLLHHNRFFCNRRGVGQGFWLGDNTVLYDSQVFANLLVLEAGGNAVTFLLQDNSQVFNNTVLIYPKEEGLPVNWAPGNGSSMTMSCAARSPGTDLYVGWNTAKRWTAASLKTEKNFGVNGNTSVAQDALFVGLAATKPSRPWFFETFEEIMVGAETLLTGADAAAGALGSGSDWSGYPYYVTTTPPAGVTLDPLVDFGIPSTLALSSPTGTGGTASFTGSVTVATPGGAVYYSVYPSSGSVPNAGQIQLGQKGDGTAATVAGTLGSSTAGVKSITSTAIAAGTYKISYVQVIGANVSPVVTTSTMTVSAAGITAVNLAFTPPYSDTTSGTTMVETTSFTPTAGAPLFIEVNAVNGSATNRPIALVVTIGTAGRAQGTGTVLTALTNSLSSNNRQTVAGYGINVPSLPGGAVTVQAHFNDGVNNDTKSSIVITVASVIGGHATSAFGTPANVGALGAGTSLAPGVNTTANGSIVMYVAGATATGVAQTIATAGATEVSGTNVSTGAQSGSDCTSVLAWEAVPTSGTAAAAAFTLGASTGGRAGFAVEVKPA